MPNIPDRLGTALADRYPIERQIGSGGMATVYLARDLKHDRAVAVKVFRGEYAASVGSERFLREIDVAARMTHPHILPLYDSGEADGYLYYVMPYVEGESLRERLQRDTRLPVEEAVQIARQVSGALGYAHRQGIVHRDIKPENILLEEGEAVVADFGIARALTAAAGDTLTASGIVIGTPHYMSPEQASGDHDLKAQTDIYSLGCVLFEMVSGVPPFTGQTAQSIIAQHISEPPPSLRNARSDTPPWLDSVVTVALAKTGAERFPTAEVLSQSLATREAPRRAFRANPWQRLVASVRRRPAVALLGVVVALVAIGWYLSARVAPSGNEGAGTRAAYPATNIGVIPFRDFSENDEGPLAAGFTTRLTDYLHSVPDVTTVSPESMQRYDQEGFLIDSIVARHELGTLIEGDVIATPEEVQVSVRLTDAVSRVQLSSIGPLARPRGELAFLLRDLSEEVGRLLRRQLGVQVRRQEAAAITDCAECLENVFQATQLRKHAGSIELDSATAVAVLDEADSLLVVAEAGDPDWVDPILERGWVALRRASIFSPSPRSYDAERARVGIGYAERVLELDPSNARAFELRGILHSYLTPGAGDAEEAQSLRDSATSDLRAAVEIDPSRAIAWNRLSAVYWEDGRPAEAKWAAEQALEADVWLFNDRTTIMRICQATFELEQLEEAMHWCVEEGRRRFPKRSGFISFELVLLASPNGPPPDVDLAWQLADTFVQAIRVHRRETFRPIAMMDVASVLARAGLGDSARTVIRQAREIAPEQIPTYDEREAMARLNLGEFEEVIRLLALYLEANPAEKARIAKDWWWRPIREHPEFRALVE